MNIYLNCKDYSVSKEEFQLLYDENLDMLVTDPQPKNLSAYYESDDYISHTDAKKSVVDKIYQSVKKKNLKNKLKIVQKHNAGKKLLDFGAGTGDFLAVAQKAGWIVSGVEPNDNAKEKAFQKGLILKDSLEDLNNEKYDVITLWHVLEHLPNLNDQITRLCNLLSENGILIIAVPNFKSYDALYYKKHWAAFDVPRHLWHFSKSSIKKIFLKQGMTILKIYPMLFDAYYVSLLSEKYKTGNQRFLAAFFRGFLSNLKAMQTKEYSSLIYVLKKA
tara:strand:+ start:168876 stop:169700 length:825 start_codon:yes stop_codon:yes gene_type:complete